jgi:DNA adenine methylase
MTPLWRYMGGKRDLAPVVVEALGTGWDRYVEPCLGAGAVALALPPGPMVLADSDGPLVRLWQAVQQRPVRLAREAAELVGSGLTAERYRAIVEREVQGDAAALLVLLQACFNGVYRRGRFGLFNTPWNKNPTPALPSEADLVEAGRHIEFATVRQADALHTLHRCSHGDAVYVDPPYAAHRGARVVLSHHDAPELRAMLRDRWEVRLVNTARPVNRDGGGRGKVSEVVVVFAV